MSTVNTFQRRCLGRVVLYLGSRNKGVYREREQKESSLSRRVIEESGTIQSVSLNETK